MKYRIYVDEVGNPDLDSSSNPNHRFLSLTGVIIGLDHVQTVLHPQMEELKAKYFGHHPDEPVIFHRKEMVNCQPPFHALRDEVLRDAFDAELLSLLAAWDYTVISVCLDKKKHKETYTSWRYDPYHYCMAVLLERFALFLSRRKCQGDVMAESRGGKEDKRLKETFCGLYDKGTEYVTPTLFQRCLTSRQLKVKPKATNVSGLQLADILAHPSRNEILHDHGLLKGDIGRFAGSVIAILQGKYDRRGNHVFGKKFI